MIKSTRRRVRLPDDAENTHLLASVDDPIAGSGGEYGALRLHS